MSQTLTDLNYHMVFSTKGRQPMLPPSIRERVHEFIGGIIREMGGTSHRIGGIVDHVHIVCVLPPKISVSDAVRTIKANSSRWIRGLSPKHRIFGWQAGYSAFTISQSRLDDVIRYVANQEEHHRKMTFREELMGLLKKHGVEYDERYIWE